MQVLLLNKRKGRLTSVKSAVLETYPHFELGTNHFESTPFKAVCQIQPDSLIPGPAKPKKIYLVTETHKQLVLEL